MEDQRLTIKKWAEEDRPREKLLIKGKSTLSEAELIAILLGSGSAEQSAVELAQQLLNHCAHDLNALAKLSPKDLQKFKGIGVAKAITIVSALELGRRRKGNITSEKTKITCSTHTYDLVKGDLMDLHHEEFWIILLKRNNELIKKQMISKGGVSGTLVDPKIIFRYALEETASSIILAHNHPSGHPRPSRDDVNLTKRLKQAGQALGIAVLDHLIVFDDSYFSFADESIL